MGKIYNIILESTVGTGATNADKSYYIDWGRLPDGPYKITFAFRASESNHLNITVANIFVDLGQGMNTVIAQNPSGKPSYRSNYLGFLFVTGTGNAHMLFCDTTTNPPLYIDRKPNNNNVLVEINTNTAPFNTDFGGEVGNYTLILSFEKQD
jgi:hypothetical protein